MIDLTQFYDANDFRLEISAPFSDADYTYATNGYIVVRVVRRPDVAETPFGKKAAKLFEKRSIGEHRQWLPIPELPSAIMEPCLDCEHGCSECVTGFVERGVSVDVGDALFMRKYLALLIKNFPDCTISTNGKLAAWFKFDGGDGLLAPMTRRVT